MIKFEQLKHKISKKNIKALLVLAYQYKTLTIQQLKKAEGIPSFVPNDFVNKLNALTGFSSKIDCIVCKSVNKKCNKCFWQYESEDILTEGVWCTHQKTYLDIKEVKTYQELIEAVRARSKFIVQQLKLAGCIKYNIRTKSWMLSPVVKKRKR